MYLHNRSIRSQKTKSETEQTGRNMEIMCETKDEKEQQDLQQELPMHTAKNLSAEELDIPLESRREKFCRRAIAFCITNDFLILVVLAICLAKAYPPLGAEYVQPQITATWIAIMIIFCTYY